MKLGELKTTISILINNMSFDLALETVRKALAINIFDGDLYYYMGLAYKHKNNYNCAYLCFENALQYSRDKETENNILSEMNKLKESHIISINNYSIVILTYNNLDYTIKCIDSIRENNKLNNYEIIVIDNNSADDTPKWLKTQKDIKYIINKENKGFPAGCNQGIRLAQKYNDIFLLNNDTIVMPNSIFNLRMALYSQDKIGATGSVSNSVGYNQKIEESFEDISEYYNYSLINNITNDSCYDFRLKLIGFALFIKRKTLDEVGLLDERFTPGNFEDDDISLRIIKSGYKNLLCKDSFIFHFGSVSFGKNLDKFIALLNTNSEKFYRKWGFNSQYSLFIRKDILNFIEEPTDTQINILEVGCACGATLLEIKNRYPNANLYGIELNASAAEIAKSFANVTAENIETSPLNYEEGFFDYIIFADVLEHLNNPLEAITKIKKYLKTDGYVLASIPNVLNYTVLKDLIDGNWTYQNSGILDRTHLRFFTYKEIIKMFNVARYTNLSIFSNTNTPKENEDKEFINKICELSNNQTIKNELLSYQYFIKAQNKPLQNTKIEKMQNARNAIDVLVKELDMNFENDSVLTELIDIIKSENITYNYVISSVEKNTNLQGKILNSIAVKCFSNNLEEYVIPLLKEAYILEPRDIDITYNLSYSLTVINEYNLALEFLNNLDKSNDNIEELKEYIAQHLT